MTQPTNCDFVIVGGGLQASLLCAALRFHQPAANVLVVERAAEICGNHTWSFHASDIPAACQAWIDTLPMCSWSKYSVQFPEYSRDVALGYYTMESANVRERIESWANASAGTIGGLEIRTRKSATQVGQDFVELEDGSSVRGRTVIDCRGRGPSSSLDDYNGCGVQSFHGFELELQEDWPDRNPILMDACVDQLSGFRFFYVLPLERRRVLVEDTYFDNTPVRQRELSLQSVQSYLRFRGIGSFDIIREESGCLPMPYGFSGAKQSDDTLVGGYAGNWFHAATGYSMPLAVRFAEAFANGPIDAIAKRVSELRQQVSFQSSFSRFLNRLLFTGVAPHQRWRIFQRFYRRLPDDVISRFYAHRFTRLDAVRLVTGAPPRGFMPLRLLRSWEAQSCRVPAA